MNKMSVRVQAKLDEFKLTTRPEQLKAQRANLDTGCLTCCPDLAEAS